MSSTRGARAEGVKAIQESAAKVKSIMPLNLAISQRMNKSKMEQRRMTDAINTFTDEGGRGFDGSLIQTGLIKEEEDESEVSNRD